MERLQGDAAIWLDFVMNSRQRFRNEAAMSESRQPFRVTLRQTA